VLNSACGNVIISGLRFQRSGGLMTMLWSKDFQILPTFHAGRFDLCVYFGGLKECAPTNGDGLQTISS
jgi:hypothetical protein